MEESEKINGKKRLPNIPSNYVTLLQLREQWIKEKERKQKGKEEKEEPQLQQEEKETNVEERVNDEVSGRGSRKNGRFPRFDRDNGKPAAEGKPRDEKTSSGFAIDGSEGFDNAKKGEELKNKRKKEKKKKRKTKKRNEMEEKARAANEGEGVRGRAGNAPLPAGMENDKWEEELIRDEVLVEKENIEARRKSQPRFIPRTHGRTAEIERKFLAMSMKGEIRNGNYGRYGMEEKARAANEREEVTGRAGNAPLPASMENNKGEEELIGDEVHVEEENIEVIRESQPRFIPRTHGRTAEIGRKFQAMSMNGEIRRGDYRRYGRQNVNLNHRGGNPELNRRYYGKFDRRRELNQRNEGMVWVKKEVVKDQNVSGTQSSSCSTKDLD